MKKFSKKIALFLGVFLVFMSFASALSAANTTNYTNKRVYGGAAQDIYIGAVYSSSYEWNQYLQYVSSISWNGQSGWKTQGFNHQTGMQCTGEIPITGIGMISNIYSGGRPSTVRVKNKIASKDPTKYIIFSGYIVS